MRNIISRQGNVNRNHYEIPLLPTKMAVIKKTQ